METINGGEMFTHLRRAGKFTDEQSKFYAAQIGAAFAHIHSKNIIHRDLKPEKILAGKVYFPKYFDKNAKALVKKILVADLSKRYGNLKDGPDDILKSKWLQTINFTLLEQYSLPAPFRPTCKDEHDISNFEDIPESRSTPPVV